MAGTLFDNIRKVYRILAVCKNCNEINEIAIPKGIPIRQYLFDTGKCPNCGVVGEMDQVVKKEHNNDFKNPKERVW